MNKFLKTVTCLYAGMAAAGAEDIVFDGNGNHGVIRFDTETYVNDCDNNIVSVKKVRIDETVLQPGEVRVVTLIIPGEVQGKQVEIRCGAFSRLNSDRVRLKIQFKKVTNVNGGFNPTRWVQISQDCRRMFFQSNSITGIDFSGAFLAHVKDASGMFEGCENVTDINFKDSFPWQIEDMSYMFDGCSSLVNLDLSDFNTSHVTNMKDMFCRCTQLQNLNLSSFDTSNVTDMECMFRFCENLTNLDLRNFHTNNVQSARCMFMQCQNLTNLQLPANFIPQELNRASMFEGCPGH